MIPQRAIGILLIALALVCTGCWDRKEVNDIALVIASSIDLHEDGRYSGMVQMAIPARQIGTAAEKTEKYFVLEGDGNNVMELVQQEQPKLSRRFFVSHRRVIFIGEKLARNGIKNLLDYFGRNPTTRLRTYVLVVKGGEGKDALTTDYPLEFVPSEAVREMENLIGATAVTLRDLMNSSAAEGVQPIMGAIELSKNTKEVQAKNRSKHTFNLNSTAVFKDLKLVGYLDAKQTQMLQWVTGKLKQSLITASLPDNQGVVSVRLIQASRVVDLSLKAGKLHISIHLKGNGAIEENVSQLNLVNPKYYYLVENEMNKQISQRMRKTIEYVQKNYNSDIFGFGETLHKKDNNTWKQHKEHWDKLFAEAEITVDVTFVVQRAGMSGPGLQLREKEMIK
ncbi:Ger(x)C family spore germination protein [Paenibacillus sedimenti]|uniref:Ger(X)C family spore germination protein n=1 Tax=Paenibacillus sedimenti TaxID=2770274 RepID=A0A926KSJ0_9BACL|nr:Ger(x)C family spore germination protein [Paenibacillus sedimenti]MBD0383175.1 Ger(x)C family spore germination protein [Paenibacillus sedimenti]